MIETIAEHADPGTIRSEYLRAALRREDLKPDPIEQFAVWFDQSVKAQLPHPNAMTLATVSAAGQPSLRTVLLKSYDRSGFVFFTNLQSRKAREIGENSHVSIMFPWLALERQVIVIGTAERVSMTEALRYFLTRPRGSQLAAWISHQSSSISSRRVLEMEFEKLARKFSTGEVPLPSFWGGYRVTPRQVEFWQGRENRLHDRFLYSRDASGRAGGDGWTIECLAP